MILMHQLKKEETDLFVILRIWIMEKNDAQCESNYHLVTNWTGNCFYLNIK